MRYKALGVGNQHEASSGIRAGRSKDCLLASECCDRRQDKRRSHGACLLGIAEADRNRLGRIGENLQAEFDLFRCFCPDPAHDAECPGFFVATAYCYGDSRRQVVRCSGDLHDRVTGRTFVYNHPLGCVT